MDNTFFFIVCIVAVGAAASVCKEYLRMQKGRKPDDPELDESLAKIERLEERIRVLERIVTENKFDLGKEIDRLQ